jgi:predicted nucleic acid-binding protein
VNSAALVDFFDNHPKMGVDTSPFLYWLEENPTYFNVAKRIFDMVEQRNMRVFTSTVTLTEALVLPYRRKDWRRVFRIYAVLDSYPHLEWLPPTIEIAGRAARLRADYNLKTPDALQGATAIVAGATALIANDPVFRRVPGLDVLLLDEVS